mmetsp:Transcript_49491/g.107766  ORF Transcript_49491/g.107766 Transcript_49491/m.107766 type:complete len:523 (+) Transcript_49491:45-1613(+)
MTGVAEEEAIDEQDKGPITYQECKIFHTEPHLVSVYDNIPKRFCTFETHGFDTGSTLALPFNYKDFDNLFRFNAELMNPNRKEGRFHWVIERLEIITVNNDRKLRIGPEPSPEVPELPIYETVRKIPTGRMDLKERHRLREQMDMLDIRRSENIARKRAATKERFLQHLFRLKEDDARRKREVEEKIEQERKARYLIKEEIERKEEEERILHEEQAKVRKKVVEVKEKMTEEKEEEELRQLRLRWKANDREKAQLIREARARKEKQHREEQEAEKIEQHKRSEAQSKREFYWKVRDDRIVRRDQEWLHDKLEDKAERQRAAVLQRERNQEFLRDLHQIRQPIFAAQLERSEALRKAREEEEDSVKAYHDKRAIPKKAKSKGRHAPASPSPPRKKKDEKGKEAEKEGMDKVLDAIEVKMRAEMEEQRRREQRHAQRTKAIEDLEEARQLKEAARMKEVRERHRKEQDEEERLFAERKLLMRTREDEKATAAERKKQEAERLKKVREANIARREQQWLAAATAA